MKAIGTVLLFFFATACYAQNASINAKKASYNAALAEKLGADAYGMKHYVFAFLKKGPTTISDSTKRMEIQMGHLKNIGRLADEGKLVIAGPFMDKQAIRGIFIFNVKTLEEAKAIIDTDPAIQAGTLEMDLHPWYGSAALMEVVSIHKSLEKKSITD